MPIRPRPSRPRPSRPHPSRRRPSRSRGTRARSRRRRRAAPRLGLLLAALATVATLVAGVTACRPATDLADWNRVVQQWSLGHFEQWWQARQAAAHGVPVATIGWWLGHDLDRFDDGASRAGRWDLSTDGCSFAPDRGPGFDFLVPCLRHDFAWRNLRRLQRRHGGAIDTRARRLTADTRFLADLHTTCDRQPVLVRGWCRALAATYHAAVVAVT